jgi:hypothetical protein
MNPTQVQIAFWLVGIVGTLVAAYRAITELRLGRLQRFKELRWRKASAAREILDVIHRHPLACAAVTMMDWSESAHTFEVAGTTVAIGFAEAVAALSLSPGAPHTPTQTFVCDSFDWFFYYLDQIEHYIRIELIDFSDVAAPLKPYVVKLRENRTVCDPFLEAHSYELIPAFVARYASGA